MDTLNRLVELVFETFLGLINFADQPSFRVVGSDLILISSIVALVVAVYILVSTIRNS